MDIPMAANIPVVSLLAKEEQKDEKSTRHEASKKRVTEIIEQDEHDLETHFVENPYIKLRKASQKQIDSKNRLNAEDLEHDQDTTAADVVMIKEEGKLVIKDFEQMEADKAEAKRLKRKHQEACGYGEGEDMSDTDSDDEKQQKGGLK